MPHYYFDKFIQNIIKPILENKEDYLQKNSILEDLIEFQIKWWKFYIIEYFNLDNKYPNNINKKWLLQYLNKVNEITRTVMNKAGIHFGHPYFNIATMAGIYRMTLKNFAEECGVEFPIK